MATHDDSGTSKKKSSDAENVLTINAENLQTNMKITYYSRTFLSIIGGVVAGILGFTGMMGFIFYFLIMAITSLGVAAKAKFSIHDYFDSCNRITIDGLFGGLMSFVLFWTYPFFEFDPHDISYGVKSSPSSYLYGVSSLSTWIPGPG